MYSECPISRNILNSDKLMSGYSFYHSKSGHIFPVFYKYARLDHFIQNKVIRQIFLSIKRSSFVPMTGYQMGLNYMFSGYQKVVQLSKSSSRQNEPFDNRNRPGIECLMYMLL
jgi:hypothetical protein